MMPFFPEIERLREIGGSTTLAYELVRELASSSYGELDNGGAGNGDRPSDPEVDELLEELVMIRKRENPTWNFVDELKQLEAEAKLLQDYGIEEFLSQTIKIVSAWRDGKPGPEIANKVADLIGGPSVPTPEEGHHPWNIQCIRRGSH